MEHLVSSFQKHIGLRGVHVYSGDKCRFLTWGEVILFINRLSDNEETEFSEKLIDTMSNYDPDREFLAINQVDNTISIELHSLQV